MKLPTLQKIIQFYIDPRKLNAPPKQIVLQQAPPKRDTMTEPPSKSLMDNNNLEKFFKTAFQYVNTDSSPFYPPPSQQSRAVYRDIVLILNTLDKIGQWVSMATRIIVLPVVQFVMIPVTMMEAVFKNVISFFFGMKNQRNEEREKRERDDFAKTDLFSRRVVDASSGSGNSNKR